MATCPLLFDVRFIGRTTDVEMDTSFRGMSPHFDRNITMIDNRLGEIDGYLRCKANFLLQQFFLSSNFHFYEINMYLYRGKFHVCVFKPIERKFIDILIVLKRRDASIINSGI